MATAALRTRVRSVWQPSFCRTLYTKRAQFTRPNESGAPVTAEVSVWMGDPDEAYVIVPRHVGKAFVGPTHGAYEGEQHLTFDHGTRRFSCGWEPILQLEVPQQMPFPPLTNDYASKTGISPATLFHTPWSPTHTIAIDDTPDYWFAKRAFESYRILRPVLNHLERR